MTVCRNRRDPFSPTDLWDLPGAETEKLAKTRLRGHPMDAESTYAVSLLYRDTGKTVPKKRRAQ